MDRISSFDLVENPILKSFHQFRVHSPVVDDRRRLGPFRNCCERSLYRGRNVRGCYGIVSLDVRTDIVDLGECGFSVANVHARR
jgi:hypothetical protein